MELKNTLVMSKSRTIPVAPKLRGSLETVSFPAFAEVKYDGELNFLIKSYWWDDPERGIPYKRQKGTKTFLVNKYGTVRTSAWLTEAFDQFSELFLVGELCYKDGKAGELYELLKNKDKPGKFFIFDAISMANVEIAKHNLLFRKEMLIDNGLHSTALRYVENLEEAELFYKEAIKAGYEGIVVKSIGDKYMTGSCPWVKVKNKDRSFFILTMVDKSGERGEFQVTNGWEGIKLTQNQAFVLATNNPGTIEIEVEHQGYLKSGKVRHPVFTGRYRIKGTGDVYTIRR